MVGRLCSRVFKMLLCTSRLPYLFSRQCNDSFLYSFIHSFVMLIPGWGWELGRWWWKVSRAVKIVALEKWLCPDGISTGDWTTRTKEIEDGDRFTMVRLWRRWHGWRCEWVMNVFDIIKHWSFAGDRAEVWKVGLHLYSKKTRQNRWSVPTGTLLIKKTLSVLQGTESFLKLG